MGAALPADWRRPADAGGKGSAWVSANAIAPLPRPSVEPGPDADICYVSDRWSSRMAPAVVPFQELAMKRFVMIGAAAGLAILPALLLAQTAPAGRGNGGNARRSFENTTSKNPSPFKSTIRTPLSPPFSSRSGCPSNRFLFNRS